MSDLLVSDTTPMYCEVEVVVRCIAGDQCWEQTMRIPKQAIDGRTLSVVGTVLQREVYEALRRAYADALASK